MTEKLSPGERREIFANISRVLTKKLMKGGAARNPFLLAQAEVCAGLAKDPAEALMPVGYSVPSYSYSGNPRHFENIRRALAKYGDAPIVSSGGSMRLMSNAEQFGLRIAPREPYYPRLAEYNIIGNRKHLPVLKTYFHDSVVIELCVGNGVKSRHFADTLHADGTKPHMWTKVDIVGESVDAADKLLRGAGFPPKRTPKFQADIFNDDFWGKLWKNVKPAGKHVVFVILGATVGNFPPEELTKFLERIYNNLRPAGGTRLADAVLIGMDNTRDEETLRAAYDHYFYKQFFTGEYIFTHRLMEELLADAVIGTPLMRSLGDEIFGRRVGLSDKDYDKLDCEIRFNIEDADQIEIIVKDNDVDTRSGLMRKLSLDQWKDIFEKHGFFTPLMHPMRAEFEEDHFQKVDYNMVLVPR